MRRTRDFESDEYLNTAGQYETRSRRKKFHTLTGDEQNECTSSGYTACSLNYDMASKKPVCMKRHLDSDTQGSGISKRQIPQRARRLLDLFPKSGISERWGGKLPKSADGIKNIPSPTGQFLQNALSASGHGVTKQNETRGKFRIIVRMCHLCAQMFFFFFFFY